MFSLPVRQHCCQNPYGWSPYAVFSPTTALLVPVRSVPFRQSGAIFLEHFEGFWPPSDLLMMSYKFGHNWTEFAGEQVKKQCKKYIGNEHHGI